MTSFLNGKEVVRYGIVFAILSAFSAFAQRDTATLVGTVLDSSGASVPAAVVVATNIDTDFVYTATSDEAGEWIISPVRIGKYRVTVASKGFKTAVAGPIALDVQQRQRVDVTLQPGEVRKQCRSRTRRRCWRPIPPTAGRWSMPL